MTIQIVFGVGLEAYEIEMYGKGITSSLDVKTKLTKTLTSGCFG